MYLIVASTLTTAVHLFAGTVLPLNGFERACQLRAVVGEAIPGWFTQALLAINTHSMARASDGIIRCSIWKAIIFARTVEAMDAGKSTSRYTNNCAILVHRNGTWNCPGCKRAIVRVARDPDFPPGDQVLVRVLEELGRHAVERIVGELEGEQVDELPQLRGHRRREAGAVVVEQQVLQRVELAELARDGVREAVVRDVDRLHGAQVARGLQKMTGKAVLRHGKGSQGADFPSHGKAEVC